MVHTGLLPQVDILRDLENHPAVACWYIHDEPDWLYTPQLVLASHSMTKQYSVKKPTMITLCRNVKFFEYGFLPDIPCHDHYSVTVPYLQQVALCIWHTTGRNRVLYRQPEICHRTKTHMGLDTRRTPVG